MKIRCINKTGNSLRAFEYQSIVKKEVFGRFKVSALIEFDIEIGKEYIVMGLIIFESYQAYIIDDEGYISVYPCQLFEVIDNEISSNWHFRLIDKDEEIYPFVQAIFGYDELCSNKNAYEELIVEKNEEQQRIYFREKLKLKIIKDDDL